MSGRSLARVAAPMVALAVAFAGGSLGAMAGLDHDWRITALVGSAAKGELPGGLVATGAADAFTYWKCTQCSVGTRDRNFIEHWNGRRWSRIALPAPLNYPRSLIAFSASSASNLWALTDAGRAAVWNGSSWAFRPVPAWVLRIDRAGDLVASMSLVGRDDLWVFSEPSVSQPTLAAHYYQGRWHKVFLPAVAFGVIPVTPSDIWTLGITKKSWTAGQPVWEALHWDGSAWRPLALPAVRIPARANAFYGLAATGPRDVWVVRTIGGGRAGRVSLLHWTGRWRVIARPSGALGFGAVVPDGSGGVWIAGVRGSAHRAVQVFYHYGRGRWTWHAIPTRQGDTNFLVELTRIPHTRSIWAIGLLRHGSEEIGDIMKFGP